MIFFDYIIESTADGSSRNTLVALDKEVLRIVCPPCYLDTLICEAIQSVGFKQVVENGKIKYNISLK